jgi:hypothetical protein
MDCLALPSFQEGKASAAAAAEDTAMAAVRATANMKLRRILSPLFPET